MLVRRFYGKRFIVQSSCFYKKLCFVFLSILSLNFQTLFGKRACVSPPNSLFGEERGPDARERRKSSLVDSVIGFHWLVTLAQCQPRNIAARMAPGRILNQLCWDNRGDKRKTNKQQQQQQ